MLLHVFDAVHRLSLGLVCGFSWWWLLLCGALALGTWDSVAVVPMAKFPHGILNLPGIGIKPLFPALVGRFLTTGHQGSPKVKFLILTNTLGKLLYFEE